MNLMIMTQYKKDSSEISNYKLVFNVCSNAQISKSAHVSLELVMKILKLYSFIVLVLPS
jgi:hypothetical protein